MKQASLFLTILAVLLSVNFTHQQEPVLFSRFLPEVKNVLNKQYNKVLSYRLPNDTVPETYDISLTTRIDQAVFEFQGIVKIGIVIKVATNFITLHHRQLVIENVYLRNSVGQSVEIDSFTYASEKEFLTIPVKTTLPAGGERYSLEIIYSGELRNDAAGFYRSSYQINGQKR